MENLIAKHQATAFFRRLHVSYRRAIAMRPDGSAPDGSQPEDGLYSVAEYFDLVHPDDSREKTGTRFNAWQELGAYFRAHPEIFWTKYDERDAVP
jgi:hypothetical protein